MEWDGRTRVGVHENAHEYMKGTCKVLIIIGVADAENVQKIWFYFATRNVLI